MEGGEGRERSMTGIWGEMCALRTCTTEGSSSWEGQESWLEGRLEGRVAATALKKQFLPLDSLYRPFLRGLRLQGSPEATLLAHHRIHD